ncbi:MAG: efflux RND transporter permease subunit, partial [Fidelibacterota bacterium]
FLIALVVLFLFIRQARAVSVVAVAVPVSLLAALAMLFIGNYSLNRITLFGLALGIGMLVDNSIVVYEAVQRRLERSVSPDEAAAQGVALTIRAIIAATATTALVFLPIAFLTEDVLFRGILKVLAVAILLPLLSSLLVAVGLVPLLARRLAAPAALSRLKAVRERRKLYAGQVRPDRGRELFSGLLKVALRRPAAWLTVLTAAVLFTVIVAIPWVGVNTVTQEAEEADQIRLSVDVPSGQSLEAIGKDFGALEQAALDLEGVEYVESMIQEGDATLTVHLVDPAERPEDISARRVRAKIREAADTQKGLEIRTEEASGDNRSDGGSGGNLFGEGPAEIVLSGPDAGKLMDLANAIKERLESIPEVGRHGVWVSGEVGQDEIRIMPDYFILNSLGLTPGDVLPMLSMLGREGTTMQTGLILEDGREIPMKIRTPETRYTNISKEMDRLRLNTPAGTIPLGLVANTQKMPPPPVIQHHNGRRELSVYYRFNDQVSETGPARKALDEDIRNMLREIHRPTGYTIDTPDEDESTGWFKRLL